VVLCGNGGSAATASHFAVDLQKGLPPYGGRPFEAVCLNDSPALLTAWGNDAGFSEAFAGPARTWLRPGDVLVAISGSGNSEDVLRAVAVARETGAVSIGLCGMGGGELARAADLAVVVPGCDLQQAEDAHSVVCHALFRALRDRAAVSSGA
jgi:D-sedoheptulose 7-phosphate isomerase